ncbi:MAG: restriction endonuclease [Pleurocapsa minor GSE-CHR-MK-17-07R]|jgi:site-specific DNA-methyltransferase (cytosine-N4-specific)|nr:restriction endonuclease [Pleurocapsa minor GSE-CHR-MK 17-07R]
MKTKSDLPVGSEFSPSQIDLPEMLEIVNQFQGDTENLEKAILNRYFMNHGQSNELLINLKNQKKLANNSKLGMYHYKIIDKDSRFTLFGESLFHMREDHEMLYKSLAKHIILNLNGMNLLQCIRDMTAAGEEVSLNTLREALEIRGVHYPSGGKHPSIMRLWLAKAGVFVGSRWQIDEIKLREVLGVDPDQFELLAAFTQEQRAFLRALANTGLVTPQPANEIARLASATYGIRFPEKSLPKLVLEALVKAGYITVQKTTVGRGAKPFMVAPTEKLIADIVDPLLDQLANQTDPKLRHLLKTPMDQILEEVKSDDRYVAGLALEALGFKLMRLIDMDYLATRLRGVATGGAEIDLLFHSKRLVYSRWQLQCKNTSRVALDDVAKEVGLTQYLKSNAIIIVSTGTIGTEARRYANGMMATSNLAIVMLDETDLKQIIVQPSKIVDIFEREAEHAMQLKKLELD